MSEEFTVGYRDRHIGVIVRIDDVTPPAPAKVLDYVFEITTYQARVTLNNHVLEELSSWTEGGKANAFQQAQGFCSQHRINRNSEVEVRVVEKKTYQRMRPTQCRDYGPKFDPLNCGSCCDVPPDSETVVWSSRRGR